MDEIRELAARVGADVFLHARDWATGADVAVDADTPVVLASVFKIPVLVELARQVGAGQRSWTDRVRVPADRRTDGPTGLSVMCDDAELSLRDLAFWMMSVSDNTATDVIMEMLGGERAINGTMRDLGLPHTEIVGDCKFLLDDLATQLGLGDDLDWAELPLTTLRECPGLQAAGSSRSTPREMTELLARIWDDTAAAPDDAGEMRRIMSLQVWPHRLTSGFPDSVTIAAKTGTLPGIRNEAGVVTYPDGGRYAVAVFTRAHTFEYRLPAVDAAIGATARAAVEHLRAGS